MNNDCNDKQWHWHNMVLNNVLQLLMKISKFILPIINPTSVDSGDWSSPPIWCHLSSFCDNLVDLIQILFFAAHTQADLMHKYIKMNDFRELIEEIKLTGYLILSFRRST